MSKANSVQTPLLIRHQAYFLNHYLKIAGVLGTAVNLEMVENVICAVTQRKVAQSILFIMEQNFESMVTFVMSFHQLAR